MQPDWRHVMLVGAIAATTLFANLGGSRLWDRDEPRNAGCAREMLERHDWVTPVFNGELRVHKPVLLYWFIMSAYRAFGINEFAARFWSAAFAVGTAILTYFIGRRLFGDRVGVFAGVILTTSLMFGVAGRAATPDSVLIFFVAVAFAIYVLTAFRPGSGIEETARKPAEGHASPRMACPTAWWHFVLLYAAMAVAVLAKGPVGVVLPTAVIGLFLAVTTPPTGQAGGKTGSVAWWRSACRLFGPRRLLEIGWAMRPFTALAVVGIVAVPWYALVGWRTDGAWLRGFLWDHHIVRATTAMEGHGGSLFFYPVAIIVGFFPWSVFATPTVIEAVRRLRRRDPWSPGYVLLACWVGVYIGFFSLARTKLPSYVTPCYPALALATACCVDCLARGTTLVPRIWNQLAFVVLLLVGLVLAIGLPIAAVFYLPGEEWLAVVGLVPVLTGIVGLVLLRSGRPQSATVAFAAGAVAFSLGLFALGAQRVDRHQRQQVLFAAVDQQPRPVPVAAFGCFEPSWVFYLGRPIEEVGLDGQGKSTRGWVERGRSWERKPAETVAGRLQRCPETVIITSEKHLEQLREVLPADFRILARAPYFLRKEDLLLLGRSSHAPIASTESVRR